MGSYFVKEAEPKIEHKSRSLEQTVDIYVKTFRGLYSYVYCFEDGSRIPYSGRIEIPMSDVNGELYILLKAMESCLYTKMRVFTSCREAINEIDNCIFEKKFKKNIIDIITIMSDKNIKIEYVPESQNIANNMMKYEQMYHSY